MKKIKTTEEEMYKCGRCGRTQSPEEISEAINKREDTFDNACRECREK